MATTVETLMARAARRYGWRAGVEHEIFTHGFFIDRINEILDEFADIAGGFREEFTINLSGTTAVHALSTRVIRLVENSVRLDYNGDSEYSLEPELANEDELRHTYGALENFDAASPEFYYTQRGSTSADPWNLVFFPRSDTARTNGIKLWARTSAPVITAITDNLPVQGAEDRLLIPGLCLAFAETELSRGQPGVGDKITYWSSQWEQAKTKMNDRVEDGLRAGRRTVRYFGDSPVYDLY